MTAGSRRPVHVTSCTAGPGDPPSGAGRVQRRHPANGAGPFERNGPAPAILVPSLRVRLRPLAIPPTSISGRTIARAGADRVMPASRALGTAIRERRRPGITDAAEEILNTAFAELQTAEISIVVACALTGRSRATHYRRADPLGAVALGPVHGPWLRELPPSTITDDERARVLALLNSEPYRDLAIPQVWARELDEGRYWCSESSMYRIARDSGQSRERRAQASHPPRVRPELVAHGPSEVWSWDITALKDPRKANGTNSTSCWTSSPAMFPGGSSPTPKTRSWPRTSSLMPWPVTSSSRTRSTPTGAAR
jgi:hypothetical protein